MSNMVVRTNVLALNSHRNLGKVGRQQANASSRLSSGFRINSAADDAAGLGISEKMRAQIRGLDQASRNGQDGISLIQTAEGAMSTINEMVVRIRELVVQAANDTNAHEDEALAQSDRVRIQDEINQLMDEIDATRNRTQFNTRNLIDGSLGAEVVGGNVDIYKLNRAANDYMRSASAKAQIEAAGDAAVGSDLTLQQLEPDINDARTSANEANTELNSVNNAYQGFAKDRDAYKIERDKAEQALNDAIAALQAAGTPKTQDQAAAQVTAMMDDLRNAINSALNGIAAANGVAAGTLPTDADELASALGLNAQWAAVTAAFDAADDNQIKSAFKTFMNAIGNAIKTQATMSGGFGSDLDLSGGDAAVAAEFTKIVSQHVDGGNGRKATEYVESLGGDNSLLVANVCAAQQVYDTFVSAYNEANSAANALSPELEAAIWTANDANKKLTDLLNQYNAQESRVRKQAEDDKRSTMLTDWLDANEGNYIVKHKDASELWFQIGANVDQGIKLGIEDVGTEALSRIGVEGSQADKIGEFTFDRLRTRASSNPEHGPGGAPYFDPDGGVLNKSGEEIQKFLTGIDEAIAHVLGQRSNLGAMQNRLEYTIENLNIASENLSAAESRIRDADMAKEMMRLTQANVLQQAATAMLAQANQAPQSVLQLLG